MLESLDLSVTVLTCQDHEPKQSYLHLLDDTPQGLMILNIYYTKFGKINRAEKTYCIFDSLNLFSFDQILLRLFHGKKVVYHNVGGEYSSKLQLQSQEANN